jgi:4-hydroxybenzoate polyprenyltransferase
MGLLRIMRPKQWTKNVIIYAGLIFDGQLFILNSLVTVTVSFVLLCMVASAIYIINDVIDVENDRKHPRKKNRPLPSGQISIRAALIAALGLAVVGVGGALFYNVRFALILFAYLLLHILYSLRLKHVVLIDILTIMSGYVLRVAAGVIVISVARFSPWLYACTALFAMFLAIGKRRQELVLLGDNAATIRPIFMYYNMALLDEMLRLVTTSAFITYLLYTIETPSVLLASSNLALLTVPPITYIILRYLYLIYVKGEGSAPEDVLFSDRPLQLAIMTWGLTMVIILYITKALQ